MVGDSQGSCCYRYHPPSPGHGGTVHLPCLGVVGRGNGCDGGVGVEQWLHDRSPGACQAYLLGLGAGWWRQGGEHVMGDCTGRELCGCRSAAGCCCHVGSGPEPRVVCGYGSG